MDSSLGIANLDPALSMQEVLPKILLSALIFLADLGLDETKVLAFIFNVFSLALKMKV